MAMVHKQTSLINGSFEQAISASDRGFSYGDGVFRTMRVRNGLPVSWPFHYQKLVADCAVIGIVCPSAELLMSDFQKLFEQELFLDDSNLVAKIIITRGEGERGYAPPVITVPTRVLIKSNLPRYSAAHYEQGVQLHVCDTKLAAQPKLAGIKHLNRLENVIARMEWRDESIFDGLMMNDANQVIECTMSNIFVRFGKQLITPDLSKCGVAGITRQRILGLSSVLDLVVSTEEITLGQLLEADEMLICNSLYGAFQVTKIANITWPQQTLAEKIRNIVIND
jgi:4-amino-4-deoxychorismate lyase